MTARDWIVAAMGRHAWAKVWGRCCAGSSATAADDISMAWL